MTFREKLTKEHPECVTESAIGGCSGCPNMYDYEKFTGCLVAEGGGRDCRACWDREIPEPEVKECDNMNSAPNKVEIHRDICSNLTALYENKNKDYGDSFGKGYGEYGTIMPVIRLEDKFNRLKQLVLTGKRSVKDESIQDTLMDLANYAIMTLIEIEVQG